ncbi:MAG: PKD domain-containing protein [Euryarchaeota archaeon]|nr:PKD domain-containing protein [Euryarchaeota archaeon]
MNKRIVMSMMALLLLFAMAATASAVSVTRDLPDAPVAAGAEFQVSISQTGFFVAGTVTEVLPPGYAYVAGSATNVDDATYDPATRTLVLKIDSATLTATYRVTAGTAGGTFTGTYVTIDANANPVLGDIAGESTVTIVVQDNHPTASFVYTPENPTINQAITFDASSSYDPDGTIVSYEWDFGNRDTGTEEVITHSYSSAGDYDVTLTVTDNDGYTASETKTVSVVGGGTTISIADANAQPDCSTTTQITIDGMTNFGAATVTLSYDPAVVHITSVAAGDVGTPIANIDNKTGAATIAAYVSTATGPNSPITFASLELLAVGSSGETSPLTLRVTTFTDAAGASVSATPKSGVFTIGLSGLRGDANDDGVVNVVDAMFVAQYAVGNRDVSTLNLANADADLDGVVNVVDAMFIAQYAVGARTW